MIDPLKSLQVTIKKYKSPDAYHEYKAPKSSALHPSKSKKHAGQDGRVCFIEAVTNERFVVEVAVWPSFRWHKCPHLLAELRVDGGTFWHSHVFDRPINPRGTYRLDPLRYTFRRLCRNMNGKRQSCGLSFAPLQMGDDPTALSADEEDGELSMRGKIEVIMQLGKQRVRKRKRTAEISTPQDALELSTESTKKVVVENGRSHFVKPLVLEEYEHEPSNKTSTWTRADGPAGDRIIFTFFYTSRIFLEAKKVIASIEYPDRPGEYTDLSKDPDRPTRHSLPTPPPHQQQQQPQQQQQQQQQQDPTQEAGSDADDMGPVTITSEDESSSYSPNTEEDEDADDNQQETSYGAFAPPVQRNTRPSDDMTLRGDDQNQHESSYGAFAPPLQHISGSLDHPAITEDTDHSDEAHAAASPLLRVMKTDNSEDLYYATPRPQTSSGRSINGSPSMSSHAESSATARRRAEILAEREEIALERRELALQRELRELEAQE